MRKKTAKTGRYRVPADHAKTRFFSEHGAVQLVIVKRQLMSTFRKRESHGHLSDLTQRVPSQFVAQIC
jgi:hypothetical protein